MQICKVVQLTNRMVLFRFGSMASLFVKWSDENIADKGRDI